MEASSVTEQSLPPLDEGAAAVVGLAAHIGAQIPDDVFISYTILLVALLAVPLGEPWQSMANSVLSVRDIRASKPDLGKAPVDELARKLGIDGMTQLPE